MDRFMQNSWIIRVVVSSIFLIVNPAWALFDQCRDYFPEERIPVTQEKGRDLCFDGFAIFYSPTTKKPIYTVERLNRARLTAQHQQRTNQFYEEARLPFADRALLSDYKNSGYDRGHNAPAGDMTSERSMAQSFSLANMMPQARENNRGVWARSVESPTRKYVMRASGDVFVYTGSVGIAGRIGKNQVVVPTHLFKLVFDIQKQNAWAYWVENTDLAQMTEPISYAELVRLTGIDFQIKPSVKAP
jgi:endonuclease G